MDFSCERLVQEVLICSQANTNTGVFLTKQEAQKLFSNYPTPYTYNYYYFNKFADLEQKKIDMFTTQDAGNIPIVLIEESDVEQLKTTVEKIKKSRFFVRAPILVIDRFYSSSVRAAVLDRRGVDMFIEVPIRKKLMLAQIDAFTRRLLRYRH